MYTFAKMCFLCLNNKHSLINYKNSDINDISACDKLKLIVPELVCLLNNKLPPWICVPCKDELDNSYIFYKKCQKSFHLLQSYNNKLRLASTYVNSNLLPQDLNIKIINTKSTLGEKENNQTELNTNTVQEKTSDMIKKESFEEDTFLFDEIIAKLDKELASVKEEKFNVETSEKIKDASEPIKEELHLFDEDTLLNEENTSGSNISVVKNEINSDLFNKNEETNYFNMFRNKSALESTETIVPNKSVCSDRKTENNQKTIPSKSTKSPSNPEITGSSKLFENRVINTGFKTLENKEKSEANNMFSYFQSSLNHVYQNELSNPQTKTQESSKNIKTSANACNENTKNIELETSAPAPTPSIVIHHLPSVENTSTFVTQNQVSPQENVNTTTINNNKSTESDLSKPTKKVNSFRRKYVCNICRNKFKSLIELNTHSASHVIKDYKCKICFQLCINSSDLELHTKEHSKANKYPVDNILASILQRPTNQKAIPSRAINSDFQPDVIEDEVLDLGISSAKQRKKSDNYENIVNLADTNTSVERNLSHINQKMNDNNVVLRNAETSKSVVDTSGNISSSFYQMKANIPINSTSNQSSNIESFLFVSRNIENVDNQISRETSINNREHSNPNKNPINSIPEIIEIDSSDYEVENDDFYMEKFFCNICNKKFKNFSEHMIIHQNENKAICIYCNKTFPIKDQLFEHLQDAHGSSEPLCKICKKSFENIELLFLHMRSHYGTEVHKCPKCEQLFLHPNSMYRHLDTVHNSTEFSCLKCNRTFDSSVQISNHYLHHKSKISTLCYICGKGFSIPTRLHVHLENVHCASSDPSKQIPQDYLLNGSKKSTLCYVCGITFKSRSRLQNHLKKVHNSSEEYKCKECDKQCVSRIGLEQHHKLKHENKLLRCKYCSELFNTGFALYLHQKCHLEEKKRFVCKICGKKFRFKLILTNHVRVHTGEKPFECKICGKTFTQDISLVVHNRIHTGEKPYTCEDCGKSYTQSYVYKMHLKKHHSKENKKFKVSKEK